MKAKACLFCRAGNARADYLAHKSASGLATFRGAVRRLVDKMVEDVEYIINQPCHTTDNEIQLFGDVRVMINQAETESYVPATYRRKVANAA